MTFISSYVNSDVSRFQMELNVGKQRDQKCPLYHLLATVTDLLADLSRLHQAPVLLLLGHPEL